jgi:hypothetical protein
MASRSPMGTPCLFKLVTRFRWISLAAAVAAIASAGLAGPPSAQAIEYGVASSPRDPGRALDVLPRGTLVRTGASWQAIELRPGRYDWKAIDRTVRAITGRGLRPLLVASSAPPWAAAPNGAPRRPVPPRAARDADWRRFVAALGHPYPTVTIQVWNEPNLAHFGLIAPDRYLQLLQLAVDAVGERRVVGAGLSPVKETPPSSIGYERYARALRDAGVAGVDPDVAIHIFPGWVGGIDYVRKVQRAYGCDTRLWVTELGSMPDARRGKALTSAQEGTQKKLMQETLAKLRKTEGIAGIVAYRLTDSPSGEFLGDASAGLFRANGAPKPILSVFRSAAAGASPPAASPCALGTSNDFRLGKVRRNERRGTAKVAVLVPGPGKVRLANARLVRGAKAVARARPKVKLSVRPRGKARTGLVRRGNATVKAKVIYTPKGGSASTRTKRIRLVRER